MLAIQLKRYEHSKITTTSSKIDIPVRIPNDLDMAKYIVKSKNDVKRFKHYNYIELIPIPNIA